MTPSSSLTAGGSSPATATASSPFQPGGGTGCFALLASRFNDLIVDRLIHGAREALRQYGIADDRVELIRVPGSWELPLAALHLARSGRYVAIVCLGCVLRGQTDHYQYVANAAAQGLARVALDTGIPIGFGVLTCETLEQALDRAGGKAGNKGAEAALAALEMVRLLPQLTVPSPATAVPSGSPGCSK
ncbi:MAG: 6,7-dimethyl-8-ribityllumazine synthase [Gemmataceae bacterium]|nr:6,7-dimethyl-8-ribityllumazine synthase [Gemmataceae bacterium]MDW8243597.1 6,7-dimethyl-8-ribityllumazine synthase [Thermogemmata sp.]